MKRFALALALVLAFSTAAMAIDFVKVDMTIEGIQTWTDGKFVSSTDSDGRIMKLAVTGDGWKALAEYSGNAILDDWYFQTKEGKFLWEIWGEYEDQNNDKATPFGWINETDDSPVSNNWEARVSGPVAGVDAVFAVENDAAAPVYYAFGDKTIAANKFGAAYTTNFKGTNAIDGSVVTDIGAAVITGEVARVNGAKTYFGAKAVLDNGINAQVYMKDKDETYLEGFTDTKGLKWFKGYYKKAGAVTTIYADARIRGSNDQSAADIIATDDTPIWDLAKNGNNKWQKNKTWTAAFNITKATETGKNLAGTVVADKTSNTNTIVVAGSFAPMPKAVLFGKVTLVDKSDDDASTTDADYASTTIEGRARYDVTPKLAIVPVFVSSKTSTKVSAHANLLVNKGTVIGGFTTSTAKAPGSKAVNTVELGYLLAF